MSSDDGAFPIEIHDVPTGIIGEPGAAAAPAQELAITVQLVCLVGAQVGAVFPLGPGVATIGRAHDAQILILGPEISRHHARVTGSHGRFVLDDFSRNGIRVNGVPVTRHTLTVGDRIQVGASAILLFAEYDDFALRAQRVQKLEAMSQVAGELAHDFKNVFMVILGNAELLGEAIRERYPDDLDLHRQLAAIERVAAGAGRQTNRLLDFARRTPAVEREAVEIGCVVDDIATMVQRTFGATIRIERELEPRLDVLGSRGELHQVMLNLCLNARDAMPSGGCITFRTRAVSMDRHEALSLNLPTEGRFVELVVADTGTGMDAATVARAFEPFFTTKGPGKGTGLGLSSVYGIVRAHGGNVVLTSSPGAGTLFRIYLPAASSPGRDAETGALRVLVFDPSREVQRAHAQMLRAAGYAPIEAGNGLLAFELFREQLHRTVAVIAPVEMPSLLDELRAIDPGGLVVVLPSRAGQAYKYEELCAALGAAGLPVRPVGSRGA